MIETRRCLNIKSIANAVNGDVGYFMEDLERVRLRGHNAPALPSPTKLTPLVKGGQVGGLVRGVNR